MVTTFSAEKRWIMQKLARRRISCALPVPKTPLLAVDAKHICPAMTSAKTIGIMDVTTGKPLFAFAAKLLVCQPGMCSAMLAVSAATSMVT